MPGTETEPMPMNKHDEIVEIAERAGQERTLYAQLAQDLALVQRQQLKLAVLFIDLDHFKRINNAVGHAVGDALLVRMEKRILESIRAGDSAFHFTSDEFVVLVRGCSDSRDIAEVAHRFLDVISIPVEDRNREIILTASIGISVAPEDGDTPDAMLTHANAAADRAKRDGGNCYRMYDKQVHIHIHNRLDMESELRQAISKEELFLLYQPQVDAENGKIVGVETLVRWQHPRKGVVSPAMFIPVAEDSDIILDVGLWVLERACHNLRNWHDRGFAHLQMAINVSGRQFAQQDVVASVRHILETTGLPPHAIEIEITESVAMAGGERNLRILHELAGLGINLAIDDFGTGYSNLAYLQRFPIDVLKIDITFVRDVDSNPDNAAIATAIIQMAHSLGFRVVAEGVETEAEWQWLRENGCDIIQGYLFGKPITGDKLLKRLMMEAE